MASEIESDLIEILNNSSLNIDSRSKGWEYLLGLTASEDGLKFIIQSNKLLPFILSYIQNGQIEKELGILAYKCLINISNQESSATALLNAKEDLCEFLFSSICEETSSFIQFKCYVLSNLSAHLEFNQRILDLLLSDKDLLPKLMKVYCSNKLDVRTHYDFLTLVFANVSRLTAGRRLFVQDTNFMTSILTFTNPVEPEVRRLGVALILRNCCLLTDHHERLLKDLSILPVILLPLMDSKAYEMDEMEKLPIDCQYLEESKERDKNPSVRRVLVQALTSLCYSEEGWNFLQSNGAYYVLRDLHLWETDEGVKDMIEDLVPCFLVESYSEPRKEENYTGSDPDLIQQLETNIIRDLPDFIL